MSAVAVLRIAVVALAVPVLAGLPASATPSRQPVPVSPGDLSKATLAASACPTFSWTASPADEGYEIAVFRVTGQGEDERLAERPVLRQTLPAGATSWTPSANRCLEAGSHYAWSVRAAGGAPGEWSEAARFEIVGSRAPGVPVRPDASNAVEPLVADPAGGLVEKLASQPKLRVSGDLVATGDYTFSATRTIRIPVPASAFQPLRTDDDEVWWNTGSDFAFINGGVTPYDFAFVTPLTLPQGSTVTRFACAYFDNWDSGGGAGNLSLQAELDRRPRTADIQDAALASVFVTSSGTSTNLFTVMDDTIDNGVIDNEAYNYWILGQVSADSLSQNLRFYGCEIFVQVDRLTP